MKTRFLVTAIAAALASAPAFATNGYFAHGYGAKSKGMAGAGSASSQETLVAATNPASLTRLGKRIDLGIEIFAPDREARMNAGGAVPAGLYDANEVDIFAIPEFGYSERLNDHVTAGLIVYGNGGMNTEYDGNIYSLVGNNTGVDLAQMFIAPTVAWNLNERNSIGLSLNIAYQRFKAYGIDMFAGLAPNGTAFLTDKGYDDSFGYGARIGWTGNVSDKLSLGASYATRTYMEKFGKYKELFAEQGDFDIPANWTLALAFKASDKINIALDVQHIYYSEVKSIANINTGAGTLGADNGPGFGWDDMTIYKLGLEYQATNNLVVRAGVSHGDQPIGANDTNFNALAPAVIEDHMTLGFTYTLNNGNELSGYYMHALENSVSGDGTGGSNLAQTLTMSQNSVGVTYSWMFK